MLITKASQKAALTFYKSLTFGWEEESPEPKASSNLGRPALHRAVSAGKESVCRLLLERGADVRKQDNNGQTPLHLAVDIALTIENVDDKKY